MFLFEHHERRGDFLLVGGFTVPSTSNANCSFLPRQKTPLFFPHIIWALGKTKKKTSQKEATLLMKFIAVEINGFENPRLIY